MRPTGPVRIDAERGYDLHDVGNTLHRGVRVIKGVVLTASLDRR